MPPSTLSTPWADAAAWLLPDRCHVEMHLGTTALLMSVAVLVFPWPSLMVHWGVWATIALLVGLAQVAVALVASPPRWLRRSAALASTMLWAVLAAGHWAAPGFGLAELMFGGLVAVSAFSYLQATPR